MLKIAVCDDSPQFIAEITSKLHQWDNKQQPLIIRSFEDGNALIQAHLDDPFQIIFLDVIMPLMNGLDAARVIRENDSDVKIVFLTASREYAFDSYSVKANNYLLKPVPFEDLSKCMDELISDIDTKRPTIILRNANSIHKLDLDKIEYLEAQNKHVLFVLTDGSTLQSFDPLYTHEEKLLNYESFFKCHRSYIVNLMHIDTYTQKEIRMHSGCIIPISRNCHKDFKTAYFAALFREAGEEL